MEKKTVSTNLIQLCLLYSVKKSFYIYLKIFPLKSNQMTWSKSVHAFCEPIKK